jgi:type II secretory pathway component PulJ
MELMVAGILVLSVSYAASTVYLNWTKSRGKADAKLRLQEDATQAMQYLVRSFRNADSVAISGGAINNVKAKTFDAGSAVTTDSIFTVLTNGRYYLAHNGAGSSVTELVVPSPIDSLGLSIASGLVRVTVRLADTTGNKVSTVSAAAYRN